MIRKANESDLIEVSKLWLCMVNELHPEGKPDITLFLKSIRNRIKNDNYYIYVAVKDNEIIGYIDAIIYDDFITGTVGGICQNFYVKPSYRKNSIGYKLLNQIYQVSENNKSSYNRMIVPSSKLDYYLKKGRKIVSAIMEV